MLFSRSCHLFPNHIFIYLFSLGKKMCPSFFGGFFVLIIHSTHAVITMPSPQRIMFFFHILNFCFFTISGRSCSAHPASLPGSGARESPKILAIQNITSNMLRMLIPVKSPSSPPVIPLKVILRCFKFELERTQISQLSGEGDPGRSCDPGSKPA